MHREALSHRLVLNYLMNSLSQLQIFICKTVEMATQRTHEACQVLKSCGEAPPPQTGSGVAVTKCQNELGRTATLAAVFLLNAAFCFKLQAASQMIYTNISLDIINNKVNTAALLKH